MTNNAKLSLSTTNLNWLKREDGMFFVCYYGYKREKKNISFREMNNGDKSMIKKRYPSSTVKITTSDIERKVEIEPFEITKEQAKEIFEKAVKNNVTMNTSKPSDNCFIVYFS